VVLGPLPNVLSPAPHRNKKNLTRDLFLFLRWRTFGTIPGSETGRMGSSVAHADSRIKRPETTKGMKPTKENTKARGRVEWALPHRFRFSVHGALKCED
jgi:hypothetical protein